MKSKPRQPRPAFTIAELLVVIVIVIALIGLTIPAFKNLLQSSERSLAENQLRAGVAAARDAAIQSDSGDGAAVFMFTPGGKVSVVACVSVGFLDDDDVIVNGGVVQPLPPATRAMTVRREVFVPVATSGPIQFPRYWSVRGYAPPNTVSTGSRDAASNPGNGWYDSIAATDTAADTLGASAGHWVFPETHFLDLKSNTLGDKGWQRQTFMIRFKAGTGRVEYGNLSLCLVVDPLPVPYGTGFRSSGRDPWGLDKNDPSMRPYLLTESSELRRAVARLIAARPTSTADRTRIHRVIGDISADTVLVRPVTEVALYNERDLAAGLAQVRPLGCRGLNRVTNTLYAEPGAAGDGMGGGPAPALDMTLFRTGVSAADVLSAIDNWMDGRATITNRPANQAADLVESDVRLFRFQPYMGQVEELVQ